MKIVINKCFGGFSLSNQAIKRYAEIKGIELIPSETESIFRDTVSYENFYDRDIERNDSILIQVIEELGKHANGLCAELKIIEIPDGIEYEIDDYDGMETIHEKHRSWE